MATQLLFVSLVERQVATILGLNASQMSIETCWLLQLSLSDWIAWIFDRKVV